jgi:ligand-binding SRPBCC domain-containing protein
MASTARSAERAVGGVTSGLIGLDQTVTWEARHFGLRLRLTSRITRFEPPWLFEDRQEGGPFAMLWHRHEFLAYEGGTLMRDTFVFCSPLGVLGRIADALVLERYMRRLLTARAQYLKKAAENGGS